MQQQSVCWRHVLVNPAPQHQAVWRCGVSCIHYQPVCVLIETEVAPSLVSVCARVC
jgi:hypothetical protein